MLQLYHMIDKTLFYIPKRGCVWGGKCVGFFTTGASDPSLLKVFQLAMDRVGRVSLFLGEQPLTPLQLTQSETSE